MKNPERIPHSRPTIVPGMAEAAAAVIRSGRHASGEERRAFEEEFARRLAPSGAPLHALAVQSGFAALHLALKAVGVPRGAPVLVPSYVCAAVLHAVDVSGARPVVADVDPHTFNMTAASARRALARAGLRAEEVACAIVPHLLGFPVPLHAWDLPIPVIEDCAMALGARIRGNEVGVSGRAAVFSFYATKVISTGQGGMVVTRDESFYRELCDLLAYDNRASWRPAFNYPLSDVAATLGRAQLAHLDGFRSARAEHAARYRAACGRLGIETQMPAPETDPIYFRFALRLRDAGERDRVASDLEHSGIEAKPPVFRPLHDYLGLDPAGFAGAAEAHTRALSIPLYPSLSAEERERVIAALERALGAAPRRE